MLKIETKRTLYVVLLLIVFVFLKGGSIYAQNGFAVRNNLIYDISGTPNIGVDARLSQHWTMGLNAGYRPRPLDDKTTRKWRHLLVAPEFRYWADSTFHRSYWGMNLVYSHYNVGHVTFPFGLYPSVRDYRKQGDLAAIGAFYGRSWRLNRFLRLEGELGLGVGYTWAKKYDCAHCGSYLGRDDKAFLIPKLTLNVVYQKVAKKQKEPAIITPIDTTPPPAPVLAVHPVADNTGKAGMLQREHPVLEHVSEYHPYDRTRVLRKEKGALYVHFPVNKADLLRDFRNNATVLDQIVDITRLIMADSTSSVSCIQVIGLASIEGKEKLNEQLAHARAQALQAYVQQHVDVPDSLFEAVSGGEAWTEFRDQINDLKQALETSNKGTSYVEGEISQGELKELLQLIETEPDKDRREQRIRDMHYGWTYKYLREHVLADQRNSGYVRIYWNYVPDTVAHTINQATQLIQQKQYEEALPLLRSVQGDPRSWNALAVALWYTGDKEAALNYFRLAAQQGNADAQKNLKQLTR